MSWISQSRQAAFCILSCACKAGQPYPGQCLTLGGEDRLSSKEEGTNVP